MSASLAPISRKRRRAVTDAQRKALRDYYYNDSNYNKKHEHLIQWFDQQFNHKINQSQVAKILGPRYKYLSEPVPGSAAVVVRPDAKRRKETEWPDLELALWEWHQRMHKKGASITGDILREMAVSFFTRMPCYAGQALPKFSPGWLEGYKARHNVKRYKSYGEADSVDTEVVEDEDSNILEQIIHGHDVEQEEEEEQDNEIIAPPISHAEGLAAMLAFQRYEEQQEHGDKALLKHLGRHERVIQFRQDNSLRQSTLDEYKQ